MSAVTQADTHEHDAEIDALKQQHDRLLDALKKCDEQLSRLGFSANHASAAIAKFKSNITT